MNLIASRILRGISMEAIVLWEIMLDLLNIMSTPALRVADGVEAIGHGEPMKKPKWKVSIALWFVVFVYGHANSYPGKSPADTRRIPDNESAVLFSLKATARGVSRVAKHEVVFNVPKKYLIGANGGAREPNLRLDLAQLTAQYSQSPEITGANAKAKNPRHRVVVRLGSVSGLDHRTNFFQSNKSSNATRLQHKVADGRVGKLVRYSSPRCYTQDDLKDPRLRQFLNFKTEDDPLPQSNCRVSRRWSELFSPLTETDPEKVVSAICMSTGCVVYFQVEGVGAKLEATHDGMEEVEREVVVIQKFLRGLIVRDDRRKN